METIQDRSIELTNSASERIMNVLQEGDRSKFREYVTTVSNTHQTLPTKRIV